MKCCRCLFFFSLSLSLSALVSYVFHVELFLLLRYMVDAADQEKLEASKNEFHNLLDKPQLAGIAVLVLANKRDLPGALDEREIIDRL